MNASAAVGVSKEIRGPDFSLQAYLDFYNDRMRIDDYEGNADSVIASIFELIREHRFAKTFVKAKENTWRLFLSRGFMLEGIFRGYFDGADAYCVAYYMTDERRTSEFWTEEDRILRQVRDLPRREAPRELPNGYAIRMADEADAERLARLYAAVFQVYPVPMHDPDYVKKAMRDETVFYLVENNGAIVSAASAEINRRYRNAEVTDCATLPEHRKHGFMRLLVATLEEELVRRNVAWVYSLARALSFGINAVFHQLHYEYAGRLTKNCYIFDKLEDMNLWVKPLESGAADQRS